MKTAVELLFSELLGDRVLSKELIELREQAKEMFEEQIMDAYYQGALDEHNCIYSTKSFEQYYNETFKSE